MRRAAIHVFGSRDLAMVHPTFRSNLASTAHPRYPAAMSTLVIEPEDELMRHLETIGSREPRQRSELISKAICQTLWEIGERRTAAAYARQPGTAEEAYFDPETWEQ